ncbi:glycosyltransferase family 2 protein [uncultured Muribaculum sp.]|uniref:glycosyltransferase family 2 protein n=1 Tax=uncultured Muribaculum sp. TaxID=1918613 RepID=UPI0025B05B0C|nr:glycosyltransferase family 2 protein [uncultured Muribaculum sp.]
MNHSSQKPVAVVILNWNGAKMLEHYLPSVVSGTSSGLADIIVADNGSDDNSIVLLKQKFPQVGIISLDRNYGFAQGYNLAIKQLGHKYVVLLNSDVATPCNWLEPLFGYMEENPGTGACQPKILSDAEHDSFEYAGAAGGYIDANGFPYCRGRLFDTVETDSGQYDTVAKADWVSGACFFVRRQVYIDAGGLDASFFAHMEEIDLCWRIRRMGYELAAIPQSHVYHLGGGTLPMGNPRKTYLNFRNNLLLLNKNLSKKVRRRKLFIRRLYDTLAGAVFLIKGNMADAQAVLRAHIDFRKWRKKTSPGPDAPELDLTRDKPNIIIQYYLKKRRFFSEI